MRELWFGGDWACAEGDLETLGLIAKRIAANADEPLRHELIELARTCADNPDAAIKEWLRLRVQERAGRADAAAFAESPRATPSA